MTLQQRSTTLERPVKNEDAVERLRTELSDPLNRCPCCGQINMPDASTLGAVEAIRRDLSTDALAVLIGSGFGDGYYGLAPHRNSANFEVHHGEAQYGYLAWKYGVLADLCNKPPNTYRLTTKVIKGRELKPASFMRFRTRYFAQFLGLREMFWQDGVRTITDAALSLLDAHALAIYYMDDGSYVPEGNHVRIAVQRYERTSALKLVEWFGDVLEIDTSLNGMGGARPGQYLLRIRTKSIARFFGLISPFAHPDLAYKFPVPLEVSA